MTAKKLSMLVAIAALFALTSSSASQAQATDTGTTGSGAKAQAQVGTQGSGTSAGAQVGTQGTGTSAGAQVGAPGTGAGANAQIDSQGQVSVKAQAGAPISGAFTLKDPTMRTFVIEGQEQVYVAPEAIDLNQFEGQDVTVTFDPNGRVTKIEIDRES